MKQIPDFLIEMSEQMNAQNNRMTADPLFEVRHKKYLVTKAGYNEHHWEVYSPESEGHISFSSEPVGRAVTCETEFKEELWDEEENFCFVWCKYNATSCIDDMTSKEIKELFIYSFDVSDDMELPEDWRIIHLQEVEETIISCLTEADAQAVIDRKQHDYPKLYIYAASLYWAPQMKELRNWILSLTKDN